MSAHRWQNVAPRASETVRRLCVVCDVLYVVRAPMSLGEYSPDGVMWSGRVPECRPPAHVETDAGARDVR